MIMGLVKVEVGAHTFLFIAFILIQIWINKQRENLSTEATQSFFF